MFFEQFRRIKIYDKQGWTSIDSHLATMDICKDGEEEEKSQKFTIETDTNSTELKDF